MIISLMIRVVLTILLFGMIMFFMQVLIGKDEDEMLLAFLKMTATMAVIAIVALASLFIMF